MPCRSVWPAFLAGFIGAVLGCSHPEPHPEPAMLTPEEQAAGWRLLFDGKTTAAWRGFKSETLPAGWRVIDGALTRVAQAGDIVSKQEFQDFELALEWKVAPGGNSGIFYRVSEAPGLEYVWQSGPEMQDLRRRLLRALPGASRRGASGGRVEPGADPGAG
jgi:hypothetical protein